MGWDGQQQHRQQWTRHMPTQVQVQPAGCKDGTWRTLDEEHVVAGQTAADGCHLAGVVIAFHRCQEAQRHLHRRPPSGELPFSHLSPAADPGCIAFSQPTMPSKIATSRHTNIHSLVHARPELLRRL